MIRVIDVETGIDGGGGESLMTVVVVRGAEGDEAERGTGGNEVNEEGGRDNLVEQLADAAADHNLTKREGEEDLMEGVIRKAVDWRRFHPAKGGDGGGGREELG